jgi:cyclopropane-fatty-acyl-phospholipid synthase
MNLQEQSWIHWEGRVEAGHRHTSEQWFEKYAAELSALLPREGILLDIGCGTCDFTPYLGTKFERVIGVDFSDAMLRAGAARIRQFRLENVTLLQGHATSLPAAINRADVILANQLLQYLDDDSLQKHVAECARVLAPGGLICWGGIPNLHRRQLWYAGALASQPLPIYQMLRQLLRTRSRLRRATRRGDELWDGIGRWFEPSKLKSLAESNGFTCEFRHSWFYEYRFHALLSRQ